MEEDDLEVHNDLPNYNDHSGALIRRFGAYQGDLVLITEYSPPPTVDVQNMADSMNTINRIVEDDYIFDFFGTFVCSETDGVGNDKRVLKSLVRFPEGGVLANIIFSDVKLGWSFRIQIAINIARSLCFLHNNNIIHNDIHAYALGLDCEWTCKLLDMFYAERVDDIFSAHSLMGMKNNSAYAAPEIHANGICSAASDIYSFGLCLFEICSRVLVTSIHNNSALYRDSAADVVIEHLPEAIPDSLRELIRQTLCLEAECRPSAEDVLDWLESLLTETSVEGDPPLPPLPKLPFPDRRKSTRIMKESFRCGNMNMPEDSPNKESERESESTYDKRRGRGGYAISRADAERLKNIAKDQREKCGYSVPTQSSPKPAYDNVVESKAVLRIPMESEVPDLEGYLQLKADNLPFYKSKFFFFKDNCLVWCSEAKLRDQPERLHYFDLTVARIVDAQTSSHWSIYLEVDPAHAPSDHTRKKMFRVSRSREKLILKFSSEETSNKWKSVLAQEIEVGRCKMCRVKLESTSGDTKDSSDDKFFFCSTLCINYYAATTSRGVDLSIKTHGNGSLQLSDAEIQALDKKLIDRRNPKTWKRILKKEGSDLSHGIPKQSVEEAVKLPQSVEEWLQSIGLERFLKTFIDAGYDCIGHIIVASLHEEDLNYLQVEDKRARLALMKESKALGDTYIKNKNIICSLKGLEYQ